MSVPDPRKPFIKAWRVWSSKPNDPRLLTANVRQSSGYFSPGEYGHSCYHHDGTLKAVVKVTFIYQFVHIDVITRVKARVRARAATILGLWVQEFLALCGGH